MTPDDLRRVLETVAARAARVGELPDEAEAGPPAGPLFEPTDPRVAGVVADWVTPVAMRWAPRLDLEPRELGRVLAQGLIGEADVSAVEVAPNGLLSLTVSDEARSRIIATVEADDDYALGATPRLADPDPRSNGVPTWLADDESLRPAQLAQARLARLIRNAEAAGVEARSSDRREDLVHVAERQLLVALADLPQRLAKHEGDRQQQVRAVVELGQFADTWDLPTRPAREGEPTTSQHGARLALARATRTVLRNGLARLGASAPERM